MAEIKEKVKAQIKGSIAGVEGADLIIAKLEETPSDLEPAATVAEIATPDATDPATVITLANANKAKINEILVALKAANLMES